MSEFSLLEQAPQPTAVVRSTIAVSDIPNFMRHAYEAVMRVLTLEGITRVGEPFAYDMGGSNEDGQARSGFPSRHCLHTTG